MPHRTVSLPPIFAIFRPEQETFQLIQPECDEQGNCLRLKNWARPDTRGWQVAEEEDREDMIPWFRGQEWYVMPMHQHNQHTHHQHHHKVHRTQIHGKEYAWWFLQHKLVWSNFMTHHHRRTMLIDEWLGSPTVPILEIQSRLLLPRTNVSFYARWCDSVPNDLIHASREGWVHLKQISSSQDTEQHDVSQLRIKTPPAKDDDDSTDEEHSGLVAPKFKPIPLSMHNAPIPWPRIMSLCVMISIVMLILGLYIFIIVSMVAG